MVKSQKIKFEKVELNVDYTEDGSKLFYMCAVKVSSKHDVNIIDFFSRLEKVFFTERYGYNFETVGITDITKDVSFIELVTDSTKYGIRKYINIHFNIGYNLVVKDPSEDLVFMLNTMFKEEDDTSSLQNFKASVEKK